MGDSATWVYLVSCAERFSGIDFFVVVEHVILINELIH